MTWKKRKEINCTSQCHGFDPWGSCKEQCCSYCGEFSLEEVEDLEE